MKTTLLKAILLCLTPALAHAGEDINSVSDPAGSGTLPFVGRVLQDTTRGGRGAEPTSLRVNVSHEKLSNNLQDWREYGLTIKHDLDERHFVEAGVLCTSRFDLEDNQINGLYLVKVTTDLVATIEGNVSPTHRVLPKYAIGGAVNYTFLPATVGQFGLKTTAYDETRVHQVTLGAERYIGAFSLGINWRPSRAFGEWVHGSEARANYYYGARSSVGMLLAAGQEVTPIGQFKTIARVRAAALIGQHWLNQDWAVSYAISRTRQGEFYDRTGAAIGLRYALR